MCSVGYAQQATPKQGNNNKTRAKNQKVDTIPAPQKPVLIPLTTEIQDDTLSIIEDDSVEIRLSKSAIKTEVKYTAQDTILYDAAKQVVYLYKNAKVEYEDLILTADFIKIELGKTLIHATGLVDSAGNETGLPVFNQGGTEYKVKRVSYNYKSKKGYLSELRTKEGEGYVKGQDVIRTPDNEFGIKASYYTTCDLDTPHFHIHANRLKIIPDKKIVTGSANLRIEGMPTPLIIPFGIFSIKRGQSSGIIIPTYGSSINRGFFLRGGGYYFGLGAKADYMVTGDIFSQGSYALNNLLRYSNRYKFNGRVGVNFANNRFGAIGDPEFSTSKDLRINWVHFVDPKARPGTSFSADVNYTSPLFLRNNSFVPQNIVANQIVSSVNFGKSFAGGKYNFTSNAGMSQNLQTRQLNISFPNLTFTVSSFNPFKPKYKSSPDKWYENISMNYTANFRNELNTFDSILFNTERRGDLLRYIDTTGRYGLSHSLPIQTSFKLFKYYTLSTSLALNDVWYMNTIRRELIDSNVVTTRVDGFARAFTYQPRIGINTRYYGTFKFKGNKLKAIRHVMSPTLDFTYTPDYSSSRWGYFNTYRDVSGREVRYSRFERGIFGGPGIGRQGNVGFVLENNIEMKVMRGKDTARKEEKIQIFEVLRFATFYNIFADSLHLAPVAITTRTKLFKNIILNTDATLDPYQNNIITNEGGFKSVVRTNEFYFSNGGKLGVITSGQIGLSATFNPETFSKKSEAKRSKHADDWNSQFDNPADYYDFNIPWNLSLTYTVRYNRYNTLNNPQADNYIQTLNFSGDINLTKNWKIAGTSGYDFQAKQIALTTFDIVRDLHCWTFKLTWIPIGFRTSFFFQINVRSSVLQDLKLTRRREWFDRPL
ncbi:MAG: hypothetical protein MUC81_08545 [Bacteroidia bacterium]|jgi:hypothetical protein|nr:hypothetical protein [Bacteroidia bacterium]